ncbi:MAG: hypothetical protein J0I84_12730, partial [Terrimonas sp.]|nr:hypothetical protein [Terrimonas sp.]
MTNYGKLHIPQRVTTSLLWRGWGRLYDLISGKVNQVHYNPGEKDEFYHRYVYDAENRLTEVYTTEHKAFVGLEDL